MRLNDDVRSLITAASKTYDPNIRKNLQVILAKCTDAEKDTIWWKTANELVNQLAELPKSVSPMIMVYQPSEFPIDTYVRTPELLCLVEHLATQFRVIEPMRRLGIQWPMSVLLHGPSGTGKTLFARYFAYEQELPYVHVRYSSLIDSHLGKSANNIQQVFDFVRSYPCVLCFDELDAIGSSRDDTNAAREVKNITIQLMQSIDSLPTSVILFGITNMVDDLDTAVKRRFRIQSGFSTFDFDNAKQFIKDYIAAIVAHNPSISEEVQDRLYRDTISGNISTPSTITNRCNEFIATMISRSEIEFEEPSDFGGSDE